MYKPKPIAMKRFYLFLAAFPLLFSSCSKTVTIEGRVTDASVNDIVVVTQTDTVSVSTIEADPSKVPGVLIGDIVKVEYELTEPESGVFVNSIRSLEIVSPSYYRIIAGTWTRKGINDADYYGFTLADDGSAESVNNNTLQVREWVLDGEELVLPTATGSSLSCITSKSSTPILLCSAILKRGLWNGPVRVAEACGKLG